MADVCFQMKGTAVTAVVMDLYDYSCAAFFQQLKDKIDSAPQFFNASPLVLNLSQYNGVLLPDQLIQVVASCRELGLQPMACKAVTDDLLSTVRQLGMASLPASNTRATEIQAEPVAQIVESVVQAKLRPSKVITKPVRSGQQIYAEGSDLILMAAVSEGAEVLADGHIHVYGPLRGRALAGVKGDTDARIFCRQMEAELVSIAGYFILNDTLREQCWKQPAHAFLEGESIQVAAI
ncbi:septum site-determining protein MinC [Neptunomonas japonica]|uniref:Probable septum site-determining protein MinC n=1 Tax=Neptunomonas japonica JAMM 1380 TaxID=1441457 RepID=A0A7R6SVH9_9GAMM|nr:septum site-determining protein MinC [Neptunomonas japonica]BBB29416.1 septum site-determining protein MinC [Neptunomonas japonica JAMM 1380]